MTHAYLTLDSIEKSFNEGGITLTEANELIKQLEYCRVFYSNKRAA